MSQAEHDSTTPTAARLRARLEVAVEKLIEALDTLHGRLRQMRRRSGWPNARRPGTFGPICPL
jgi:hypothetical protein